MGAGLIGYRNRPPLFDRRSLAPSHHRPSVLGLLGVLQVGVAPSAGATVFNVTSAADSGPGTFDAAVTAATADATSPHVIDFTPGLVVTKDTTDSYYLGPQPLTINGNGSTVTAGGGSPRILTINTAADVVINDLTMTDTSSLSGYGAVFQNGTGNVTINDSVISDHEGTNGAGAIRGSKADSTLTINRSRFLQLNGSQAAQADNDAVYDLVMSVAEEGADVESIAESIQQVIESH